MTDNTNKRTSGKAHFWLIPVIAGISIILFVALMCTHLMYSFKRTQIRNNESFFSTTISNLDSNTSEIASLTERFNHNNNIMVDDLVRVYSYDNFKKLEAMSVTEQSDLLMRSTYSMAYCSWIMVTNRDGEALMADSPDGVGINIVEDIDLGEERFHQL